MFKRFKARRLWKEATRLEEALEHMDRCIKVQSEICELAKDADMHDKCSKTLNDMVWYREEIRTEQEIVINKLVTLGC